MNTGVKVKQIAVLLLAFGLFATSQAQTSHSTFDWDAIFNSNMAMMDQLLRPAPALPTIAATKPAAVNTTVGKPAPALPTVAPVSVKVVPKTPYDSTQGQLHAAKLENVRFEFDQARQDLIKEYQQKFDAEKHAFDAWSAAVCKANGWNPNEYQYSPKDDTWYHLISGPQAPAASAAPAIPAVVPPVP